MSVEQDAAVQAARSEEQTLPDGRGGVITRTAPSTSGDSYAGGVIVENDVGESQEELMAAIEATIKPFDEGDIVVKVLAEGKDPNSTTAGELGEGKPVTIGADDDIDTLLSTMADHKVRRLPVIDGHELIGIVSQADVANNLEEEQVGRLVDIISS